MKYIIVLLILSNCAFAKEDITLKCYNSSGSGELWLLTFEQDLFVTGFLRFGDSIDIAFNISDKDNAKLDSSYIASMVYGNDKRHYSLSITSYGKPSYSLENMTIGKFILKLSDEDSPINSIADDLFNINSSSGYIIISKKMDFYIRDLRLIDISGATASAFSYDQNQYSIDVSRLAKGVYMLVVEYSINNVVRQVVKKITLS